MNIEERIRAALNAAAADVTESRLRPAQPPRSDDLATARRRARWLAPVLAAAAVIAVVVGTTAVISSQSTSHKAPPAGTSSPPVATPTTSVAPSQTTSSAPSRTESPSAVPMPTDAGSTCFFADLGCKVPSGFAFYEPLWPFASLDGVAAWVNSSGSQPWHLDPGETALLFAQNYLGFRDIAKVTSTAVNGDEARIGVGYDTPSGQPHTAAVLHLVRYASTAGDKTAPWEVVGSDDTDFSLEQPAYGSQVSSPITVGGHITGVDENIVVVVRNHAGDIVSG
ncbi:MAG: hypothetical protein QOK11_3719, partial [Pseudonocardiales bacterium]|nr:hypothetical protein [Pseudonocardiales bacterium]